MSLLYPQPSPELSLTCFLNAHMRTVGSAGTYIQVLVEAQAPNTRLCIVSQDYDPFNRDNSELTPQCDIDQLTACFLAPNSGDFKLMIYCADGVAHTFHSLRHCMFIFSNRSLDFTASILPQLAQGCSDNEVDFKYKVYHSGKRDTIDEQNSAIVTNTKSALR